MNLLTINNMTKSYADKILFDQASFSISENEKIGIIGINGTGKSTLLKIIAGIEEADISEVVKGKNTYIRFLSQNPEFELGTTIYEYVIQANVTQDNEWLLEGEAKTILYKLGFRDYSMIIDHLSGGQKKKVALAAALLSSCDILVLDEPTNHLDNSMIEWLEHYLLSYKGALVMVTHDRYFLDRICNRIVEIDKGNIYSYDENYGGYLLAKAEREDIALATERKHKSIYRKELEWMKRGARARSTKQKSRIERFEVLKNEDKILEESTIEVNTLTSRMGNKTIELKGISKSYGDRVLIQDFTYYFMRNDKIGIIGPNASGKTTLMKIIHNIVEPDEGTIEIGSTVKIGYFSQDNDALNMNVRVIDYIRETAENIQTTDGFISASQMLEKFLFDATLQYTLVGRLSGGEKRRLYLIKVLMEEPNVLVLDEPTNDLDIKTLSVLEDYLDGFPGILITVSHDRFFLDRVARRLFAFEGEGSIRQFEGTYSDYYESYAEDSETNKEPSSIKKDKTDRPIKERNPKIKFTFQEQKDYNEIEQVIMELEEKVEALDVEIVKSSSDFVKLNQLMKEKEEIEESLEERMERYIYLCDLQSKIEEDKASR